MSRGWQRIVCAGLLSDLDRVLHNEPDKDGLDDLRDEHDPRRIMRELDLIDERNRFRQEGDE